MKYLLCISSTATVLAAALFAPAALAQTTTPTPAVMTDTAPLPAQERQSLGAIVFSDSMVMAQRTAYPEAGKRTYMAAREARDPNRLQREADLAAARADEATKVLGGSSGQDSK